jgi:hypothetical protein
MIAYLIGNGASIECGAPAGADIFAVGLDLLRKSDHTSELQQKNMRNILWHYLQEIVSSLDDLRSLVVAGQINSLHVGKFHSMLLTAMSPRTQPATRADFYNQLRTELGSWRIWDLFPRILEYYNDSELHGFLSLDSKRGALIDSRGNLYDDLAYFSFLVIYYAIATAASHPTSHDSFARSLTEADFNGIIIALNYDCLLENAMERAGMRVVRGDLVENGGHLPASHEAGQGVLIFKPHGSFDCACCPSCGQLRLDSEIPIESMYYSSGRKRCEKCGRLLAHYFIPYTSVDLPIRHLGILERNLARLRSALTNVSEVVSIGYSFSQSKGRLVDDHLQFIFGGRKLKVVSKDLTSAKKICEGLTWMGYNATPSACQGFVDFARSRIQ